VGGHRDPAPCVAVTTSGPTDKRVASHSVSSLKHNIINQVVEEKNVNKNKNSVWAVLLIMTAKTVESATL
jgi:hypothetical protein